MASKFYDEVEKLVNKCRFDPKTELSDFMLAGFIKASMKAVKHSYKELKAKEV